MRISTKYSLLFALLLMPFLYAMWFTFPIGDDIGRANRATYLFDIYGGFNEMLKCWWRWSGRYTHHFFTAFFADLATTRTGYAIGCTAFMSLFLISCYGIFSELGKFKSRLGPLLPALICVSVLYCGQNFIQGVFYLLTDFMGIGMGNGFVLMFIWALCRIWFAQEIKSGHIVFAVISAFLAIGSYEHSAVATIVTATASLALACGYDHPHKAAFKKVFIYTCIFFIISIFSRGNFRRQTKRGPELAVILQQLAAAPTDWLATAFDAFKSRLLAAPVLLAVLIEPHWKTSFSRKFSTIICVISATACFLALTTGIVLIHAVSDVTIRMTPKLPASMALLVIYIITVLLFSIDWLHSLLRRTPARLTAMLTFIFLACSPNFTQTFENMVSGEFFRWAAIQEQRYSVLRAHPNQDMTIAPLDSCPYPACPSDAFPYSVTGWAAKDLAQMFGVKSVHCSSYDASTLAEHTHGMNGQSITGLGKVHVARNIQVGPNSTYNSTWLVIEMEEPLIMPVITFSIAKTPSSPYTHDYLYALLRNALTAKEDQGRLNLKNSPYARYAGRIRAFKPEELYTLPGTPDASYRYAAMISASARGQLDAIYVGITPAELFSIK